MIIYLIRHTTPSIPKGTCYGQTDIELSHTFAEEAATLAKFIPPLSFKVYSSPLQRCKLLAKKLFPDVPTQYIPELMEINCGQWEMKFWDDIPKEELNTWMFDFVNCPFPNGESYIQFHERISKCFQHITSNPNYPLAIITHGGVIRSILSYLTHPLQKSGYLNREYLKTVGPPIKTKSLSRPKPVWLWTNEYRPFCLLKK